MSTRHKKSTEEITKANLHRTLNKLKTVVAEREEAWLDFFGMILPLLAKEDVKLYEVDVKWASQLADCCLREYEDRWGKAS